MKINKLILSIKVSIFIVLLSIATQSRAEYYVVNSCPACPYVRTSSPCLPKCAVKVKDYKCESYSYKTERITSYRHTYKHIYYSKGSYYSRQPFFGYNGDYNFDGRTGDDVGSELDIDY